jgi:hypothetical protein
MMEIADIYAVVYGVAGLLLIVLINVSKLKLIYRIAIFYIYVEIGIIALFYVRNSHVSIYNIGFSIVASTILSAVYFGSKYLSSFFSRGWKK